MDDKIPVTLKLDHDENELMKSAAKRFGDKFGVYISKRSFIARLVKLAAEEERKLQRRESI